MPIKVSYPGVYVEEVPGGQPVTAGVSTSTTAFVDFFSRGPMNKAVRIVSMADFIRTFGGLHPHSEASYGLKQYFLNGGLEAWVVRATDGAARKANLDVRIETPGLAARQQWATESAALAERAQQAAREAADAAQQTLVTIDPVKDNAQQLEQKSAKLRGETSSAALETEKATAATRDAAVQAKASSDELAIAIAALAAAAGPVAPRTAHAARHSADAAAASSAAAKTNADVIIAAQAAVELAKQALKQSSSARASTTAGTALADALKKIDAVNAGAQKVDAQNSIAKDAEDETAATAAATQAAILATEVVEDADQAVRDAQTVVGMIADFTEGDEDQKAVNDEAKKKLEDLDKLDLKAPANDAAQAQLAAQAVIELKDAQDAANQANTAAQAALTVAQSANEAATWAQKTVLAMASEAAKAAAAVAQKDQTGKVVDDASLTILAAIEAAKSALVAAKLAADDARVAASCVGSAAVNMAAREAIAGAEKAVKDTAEAIKQAKAVTAQLSKAKVTALQSVAPAEEASAAATAGAKVGQALDAAQAALNAADNALAASELVEKAAVEVSSITLKTTRAADLAARAAKVAVDANEEAGRPPTLRVLASNEGVWGDNLQIEIEVQGAEFSLVVGEFVTERGVTRRVTQEAYNFLNLEGGDKKYAVELVNDQSKLITLDYIGPMVTGAYPDEVEGKFLSGGDDGGIADASQLTGADGAMPALNDIQPFIFNLLCLPSVGNMPAGQASVAIANAQAYCARKRAFFLVDIPQTVDSTDKMLEWVDGYGNAEAYHMAVYFPRLVIPDPLQDFRPRNVGASGTLAGIYARTDTQRGVWKAPAGINAVLQGAEVALKIDDDQNGLLNPRGVNVLRSFPIYGNISWGARTLAGADAISSEWKYVSVRRLLNYIEESLFQSLKWAVFEPNDSLLWAKMRDQVTTFLSGLYSQGAFVGGGAGSSFFVTCDGTTTSPVDIDLGVVNVEIGVAPVKPAEFIVLHFQQIAGQSA